MKTLISALFFQYKQSLIPVNTTTNLRELNLTFFNFFSKYAFAAKNHDIGRSYLHLQWRKLSVVTMELWWANFVGIHNEVEIYLLDIRSCFLEENATNIECKIGWGRTPRFPIDAR